MVVSGVLLKKESPNPGFISTYRGELALRLSRHEMMILAKPFHNALVGHFAYGCPPMEVIRKFVISLGLKGECLVGLLDSNQVLFCPILEDDYT